MKSSEVSIKTRSTPASLSFKGQATKHTTIKWSMIKGLDFLCKGKQSMIQRAFTPYISLKANTYKKNNINPTASDVLLLVHQHNRKLYSNRS